MGDEEEIMDYYAIGQITPGVIAVNTATFIGYKQKKSIGGIAATLGVVSPSIIIILILANIIDQFSDITIVQHAFKRYPDRCLRARCKSGYQYDSKGVKDIFTLAICLISFVAVGIFRMSPIPLVVIFCFLGIFTKGAEGKK